MPEPAPGFRESSAPRPRPAKDQCMTSIRLERWIARKFRLRHVELIAALYECRSILKASRRLNLTQPTLTKALQDRSEEHTSELQSQSNLVCRLLLEKKNHMPDTTTHSTNV